MTSETYTVKILLGIDKGELPSLAHVEEMICHQLDGAWDPETGLKLIDACIVSENEPTDHRSIDDACEWVRKNTDDTLFSGADSIVRVNATSDTAFHLSQFLDDAYFWVRCANIS